MSPDSPVATDNPQPGNQSATGKPSAENQSVESLAAEQSPAANKFISGTVWVFLAEALIFPTGIVTAGILTRRLGADGYGILTLGSVLVSWIEWTITSIFSRTAIKFISGAADWRPVGTVIAQLHVFIGAAATVVLWVFATPIAELLDIPTFVPYLRLLALDIPIFCLAYAHRQLLVGRGFFVPRAIASAGRWVARLAIIAVLVEWANWSIWGAILGSLGASVVELLIGRWFVRPPLLSRSTFPARDLFGYALPLFLFATSLRLFDKLDLFMLKIMGGTVAQAGIYGAAQNLAFVPGIFALSFSPLLLSTLNQTIKDGHLSQAKTLASNAVRGVVALMPFVGLAAAAAVPVVKLVYGTAFVEAGPVLAVLIFAAMALVMISVVTAILTAAGRPNLTAALVAPMLPISAVGYWLFVPRYGAMAACWVNFVAALLGAIAALIALYRIWQITPPAMTAIRSVLAGLCAYAIAARWLTPDATFLYKLLLLSPLVPLMMLALGEISRTEWQSIQTFSRDWLRRQKWFTSVRSMLGWGRK